MASTAKDHSTKSESKVTREGRTIVDARDLLQDKAVKDFIRELSASIKDTQIETDTKKTKPFE